LAALFGWILPTLGDTKTNPAFALLKKEQPAAETAMVAGSHAIAQTALTLTALKREDLEGTAKIKVAAQISTPQVIPRPTSHRNRFGHAPDW
jgi:hypothetical protein